MSCNFLEQFKKLKKSSINAVVDGNNNNIDDLKKYLHIVRDMEEILVSIIKKVNYINKKTLILICGSAGDGKSHLLSVLKNSYNNLLDNYVIHNDSTESFEPGMDSIETLNNVLSNFSDSNINKDKGENLIIAINLGTLNNFIESKFACNYTEFRNFVVSRNILNGEFNITDYVENSNFQSINFGDFKNYTLTENGIKLDFILNLINKITVLEDNNIFYKEYLNCKTCSHMKNCPVQHNYELLQNKQVQKNIANKLIELCVKEKYFLSTREILDFIYNIIVHHDFEKEEIFKVIDNNIVLSHYIDYTLPTLMFEKLTINPDLNLSKFDYLKTRLGKLDEDIINFNVSNDIYALCEPIVKETAYKNIINQSNLTKFNYTQNNIKTKIFKFILRTKILMSNEQDYVQDLKYEKFLKYLYWFNTGNINQLKSLYDMLWVSILKWNGYINDNCILINKYNNISLFAKLELEPSPPISIYSNTNEIKKFENNIKIGFIKKDTELEDKNIKLLNIDYYLYSLIFDINNGYLPNAQDKQLHIEFDLFVSSLSELSSANKELYIVSPDNKQAIFKNNKSFGYEFKVINI